MFRKKPYIPPRPIPPDADQIEHDLREVADDDVVFKLFENVKIKEKNSCSDSNEESGDTFVQNIGADTVYGQVKRLVEANKELEDLMRKLSEKDSTLRSSRNSLICMADEIRQQSMAALK